jgi:hypothetical protein
MKACRICLRMKSFTKFHRKPGVLGSRDAVCKDCRNLKDRENRARRKEAKENPVPEEAAKEAGTGS